VGICRRRRFTATSAALPAAARALTAGDPGGPGGPGGGGGGSSPALPLRSNQLCCLCSMLGLKSAMPSSIIESISIDFQLGIVKTKRKN